MTIASSLSLLSAIYEITVTEFNDDFVKYIYSSGGSGMSGRKWFLDVEVGQVWKMSCNGALVVECVRVL
jgi:hypothetical protein